MSVKCAVIPAAGFGTRMLPAAKAVPKEMLPVLDRPAIQWIVQEAADAGVANVVLVTSPQKPSIAEHFQPNLKLTERLQSAGKVELLASLQSLMDRISISEVLQTEARGLGDAVAQARQHVGDRPFLCQLGDAIFSADRQTPLPAEQLIDAHNRLGGSIIGLEEVPAEKVSRYGIVGGKMIADGLLKLDALVEKPSPETAPSRFAIAARYVLSPTIFTALDRTSPGKGGEIQLTDALKLLLDAGEPIHGVILKARRHDIGNAVDWLKTNLILARRDQSMWKQIEPVVRAMLDEV